MTTEGISSGHPQKGQKQKNKLFTLKVLSVVREAQLTHGLRHNDYQLYRQYCTRRIRRLRRNLALVQGDKKNFRKKAVSSNMLKDERYLLIPLMTIERCWAYAMQLKEESIQDNRKKYAMRNKLKKASSYVVDFESLVEESNRCDARTQLEVKGYSAWLQGTVLFEMAEYNLQWNAPVEFFNKAHAIYSKLTSAISDDESEIYKSRLQELEVKLRYCRHHLGDKAATDTLLAMRGNEALGEKLDKLVSAAKERQASTLSEVTWKGRVLAVKHENVRMFLLNEGLIHEEVKKTSNPEDRAEMLDKVLMECKDAIQIIREDLKSDSSFKSRQQANEGSVSPLHFLHSFLSYLRLKLTILRNLSLYHSYCDIIRGEIQVSDGKKTPKLQDIIRLCDLILQNINEIPQLAGLEDDLELKQELEGQRFAYNAHKCYHIAENFALVEKWSEALVMYQRTAEYVETANKHQLGESLKSSLENLEAELEKSKLTVNAQFFLSKETSRNNSPKLEELERKYLIDRLDEYVEDKSLTSKSPKVAVVPPPMAPVPCKPLFFDLALNHIDFPIMVDETKTPSPTRTVPGQEAQAGGGIRGLVRGLWGGWGS